MRYKDFHDIKLSRLGMGNMRLPQKGEGTNASIDWEKSAKMIDHALAAGINYFDTAWVYNNGESERCIGSALSRHPRDSYYLADKFYIDATTDYQYVFEEQLRRLQTDHIDFYLMHCLMDSNIDKYLSSGAIEYMWEQKAKGRIRYLGFSSHASVETLRRFADHHAWDFAQLQLNYFDWKYYAAWQEYDILTSRNIPVMVMEPVRGGKLASLPAEAEALLKAAHPDWSPASWAMRFVDTLPAVQVILSGMSNMEQLQDNIHTFESDETLSEGDLEVLGKARDLFRNSIQVPCTACRYCCSGCPMEINIPAFLHLYNDYKITGPWVLDGLSAIQSKGQPSDCIRCHACEGHCPQHIAISDTLHTFAAVLEKK